MKQVYGFCLTILCLSFTQLSAKDDLVVPLNDGNTWIYAIDIDGYYDPPTGGRDFTNLWGTETWTVVGDSVNTNGKFKIIRTTFSSRNLQSWSRSHLVQVDAVRMRFSLDYCPATEMEHWGDYINIAEEKSEYQDSLVCAHDEFGGFNDLLSVETVKINANQSIFNVMETAQQRTYDGNFFEAGRRITFTTMPQFGIIRIEHDEAFRGGGSGLRKTTKVLRGAIIDGKHYGDTNTITSVPIPDGSFTSEPSILIFPNPISDSPAFQVSGKSEEFEIQIYDLLGRNLGVFARGVFDEFSSQTVHTDASHLARGSYIAVLVYDDKIQASTLMMK